jgi:hypothetical protein
VLVYVNDRVKWELQAYSPRSGTRLRLSREMEDVGRIVATEDEVIGEAQSYGAATRRKRIKTWPLHGGEPRDLGEGYLPALTPDGAQIVFAQAAGASSRIVAAPRRGGPLRTLAEVAGDAKEIGVGRDGVLHVTVRGQGAVSMVRLLLSGGAEPEASPDYARLPSPAAGWTLLISARAEGGREARLVADGGGEPSFTFAFKSLAWTPKGDAIVYNNGTEVRRYSLAARADEPLFPTHSADGIATSPDGETIYVNEGSARSVRRMITNFAERR